jgi:DNA-binding CsgD family transcriptional regulator/N-acetylneuraminic acid mutarotase
MHDDKGPLSEREREVLMLVATGASNQEIAQTLVISPNTVKVHLRNIFEKLGVQSRTEATMEAVRRGWVTVPAGAVAAAAEEPAEAEFPLPARPPVVRWQRIYMVIAAILITAAALIPSLWRSTPRPAASAATLTDRGMPQGQPEIRTELPRWSSGAPLPQPASRLALAADERLLYAVGGETAAGVTGQLAAYDPENNRWQPGPDKPTPASNISAALIDGKLYAPGGVDAMQNVSAALEAYDTATGAWETLADMPGPRAAYALAAHGGKLYLFGGWDGASYRAETFIYDPATDRWSTGTPMPEARGFAAAGALEKAIYVAGGFDGAEALDRVEAYQPAAEGRPGGPWSRRAALSLPRAGLGLATLGARLYAIGGGWSAPATYNEQYDERSGAWSRIETPAPGEWRNLAAAGLGQTVYAVGGWDEGYLDLNAAYTAILRMLIPFGGKGAR